MGGLGHGGRAMGWGPGGDGCGSDINCVRYMII